MEYALVAERQAKEIYELHKQITMLEKKLESVKLNEVEPGVIAIVGHNGIIKQEKRCSSLVYFLRNNNAVNECVGAYPAGTTRSRFKVMFETLAAELYPQIEKKLLLEHGRNKTKAYMNFDKGKFRYYQERPIDVMRHFFDALQEPKDTGALPDYDAPLQGLHISLWNNGANTVVFSWDSPQVY